MPAAWGSNRRRHTVFGIAVPRGLWLLAALSAGFAVPAAAQVPPSRADSLEVELRRLQARMDSLERVIARLLPTARDTAQVVDELAALRAAARAAAGTDTTTRRADSATTSAQDRSTNLNRMNPEISATADVRLQVDPDAPTENNVDVREFEFSFQAALDPYAKTKIFLSASDEGVSVEEGYAYWTGLPGGVRVDLGRFRQQVGELNRWHPHSLPESEYPLVLREYFGDEGLNGDGLGVYWTVPVGGGAAGTWEVWGQATLANNDALYAGGNRIAGLGHVNAFWQLSPAVFFQLGGTLLGGSNPDSNLTSTVFGGDFRLTWRPPARALYQSLTLRGEGYVNRRTRTAAGGEGSRWQNTGVYVSAQYQLSRRLFAGARFDWVEPVESSVLDVWAIVPALTWWQSEWVYLRLEWQHQRETLSTQADPVIGNRILLQTVWAIGPHKHENY
jgi:hypothetical protein